MVAITIPFQDVILCAKGLFHNQYKFGLIPSHFSVARVNEGRKLATVN